MSGIIGDNVGRSSGLVKAAGGGGKMGQCLQAVKTDRQTTTSTSYVDVTDLSIAITPAATSSKVLVVVELSGSGNDSHLYWTITDTSDNILTDFIGDSSHGEQVTGAGMHNHIAITLDSASMCVLHSPASASEVVYKVMMKVNAATSGINHSNTQTLPGSAISSITVMEVLA